MVPGYEVYAGNGKQKLKFPYNQLALLEYAAAGRGEILFLRFRVKNRKSWDIEIRVNGVCNKLSARSQPPHRSM